MVDMPYMQQSLCKDHFVKFFEKRIRRTIRVNKLIDGKDTIAVGLSGGKDSTATTYLLHELLKENPNVRIVAITLDEGIGECRDYSTQFAKDFCKGLGIEHHIYTFKKELGFTMQDVMKKVDYVPACSFCGVFRRHLLNVKARELSADKLAVGHNLDDEAQVGLMNFIRGDMLRMARAGVLIDIVKDEHFVPRIKPLRDTPESEVAWYVILKEFAVEPCTCPFAGEAYRNDVRRVLDMMENGHPGTRQQIIKSMDKLVPVLRKEFTNGKKPAECERCGELTSGSVCKVCEMKEELGF